MRMCESEAEVTLGARVESKGSKERGAGSRPRRSSPGVGREARSPLPAPCSLPPAPCSYERLPLYEHRESFDIGSQRPVFRQRLDLLSNRR